MYCDSFTKNNILISRTNHHQTATTKPDENGGTQHTVVPIITVFFCSMREFILVNKIFFLTSHRTANLKHLAVLIVLRQLILRRSCWTLFSKRISDSEVNYGHQITNNNCQTQQYQRLHCCKDSRHCLTQERELKHLVNTIFSCYLFNLMQGRIQ